MLDLPRGTVNSRLRRALDRLGDAARSGSAMEPERLDELLRGPAPGEAAARERARVRIADGVRAAAGRRSRRPRGRVVVGARGRGASRSSRRSARRATRSPTGSATAVGLRPHAPAAACRAAGERPPSRRAAARLLGRHELDRRGERQAPAARRVDRAPRGRRTGASSSSGASRRLAALDRRGSVRWSLLAPRPVTSALWSPSGFRVAYRSGQDLRVVAGDGTGDRLLDPGTFRPMAWRPGRGARARLPLGRAHRHRRRRHRAAGSPASASPTSRTSSPGRPTAAALRQPPPLAGDLRRARAPHRPHLDARPPDRHDLRARPQRHARRGRAARPRRVERGRADGPGRATACCSAPTGASPACASRPRGRWLLVAWPLADQWVFLRPGATGARRVLAAPGVTRRFGVARLPAAQRLVLPAVSLCRAVAVWGVTPAGARCARGVLTGSPARQRAGVAT